MTIVGSVRVFALLIVLPSIIRLVRGPASQNTSLGAIGADNLEVWLIRACPLIEMIGFTFMGLAKSSEAYYVGGSIAAFGGLGPPTLQSASFELFRGEVLSSVSGAQWS